MGAVRFSCKTTEQLLVSMWFSCQTAKQRLVFLWLPFNTYPGYSNKDPTRCGLGDTVSRHLRHFALSIRVARLFKALGAPFGGF